MHTAIIVIRHSSRRHIQNVGTKYWEKKLIENKYQLEHI